eukprot:scaffold1462_cov168-Ochromonas_danica.AAC.8
MAPSTVKSFVLPPQQQQQQQQHSLPFFLTTFLMSRWCPHRQHQGWFKVHLSDFCGGRCAFCAQRQPPKKRNSKNISFNSQKRLVWATIEWRLL